MTQRQFDDAGNTFSAVLHRASHWRDSYFGAVHSTRLRQAILDTRAACDAMEAVLEIDEARHVHGETEDKR